VGAILVSILVGTSFLGLLSALGILYHVVRQQGSLLIRVEALEQRLAEESRQEDLPQGLPIGDPIAGFKLPDFTGRAMRLEEISSERILLVNWSPACGFCQILAPELGRLRKALLKRDVGIVLLAQGDVESNRRLAAEHGLAETVLLQDGSAPIPAFARLGTPVAYVLDRNRNIAQPLAVGSDAVLALAEELATREPSLGNERSLGESRLERSGLKTGAEAPDFRLSTLDTRTASLANYRGGQLLLVFSDPHCGPCNALLPELAQFHRDHGKELAILMITRGDAEENRAKIEEHDVGFRVALQPGWRISKKYGIFETPVAFLIDADGTLATGAARGKDEIFSVVRYALARGKEVHGEQTLTAV